ncbi:MULTISPECIES: ATP-dependent RecD-like DNA helicase [Clostridia]|uniref:SF1B family DNA helicase RecD2 n=1 Tax=Clostridia TaxID=186801 RepID=UPI000EA31283|nr:MULTISPECIES: ATP-dependent RecD-like DNA helicase [Clostridia]NBJ68621.1 ATP-dependent RecD-like DNA helicase [Roseburia sp. 1XD42-34]RKI80697.1 ATP-dependent RecD-like DNA helicase [Clostridium sp. 1xD42-85]
MEQIKQTAEHESYIRGELLHLIFQNEAEHFSIAKIKVLDTNEAFEDKTIVIKGYFFNLQPETSYYFYGIFDKHPRFGTQYKVTSYKTFIPDTKDGLIAYLSSDLFYGIGKKTATKIVQQLGENAITKIMDDPEALYAVPGIKAKTADQLRATIQENQGFEHVAVHLSQYNIGLKMSQKIYQQYKDEAVPLLEADPYQFVFDIEGFGFRTADEIARQMGLPATHPTRVGAGCIYVLQSSVQDGHVYLPMDFCITSIFSLLNTEELTESMIIDKLKVLNKDKKVIVQDGNVYLPSLYYAEDGFSSQLKRILQKPIEHQTPMAELMKIIGDIEEEEILSYGKEQFTAINQALHAKVMILTGGPGTGKTTVIKGILKAYATIHDLALRPEDYDHKGDFPFILTAPTGRAAKRLNESTGLPAMTVHRLLGWDGNQSFEKNEHEPLSGKFIIIDEFSMVDIWLANHLFKAIPDDMQVLIVGDEDQLPSVGPGQVLSDLLSTDRIPYVRLTEVYRQKEGSKIIQLAHEIKKDEPVNLQKDHDFNFIHCNEIQMVDVITKIFKKAIEKGIESKDIQVLAPMYRSEAGITKLNQELQKVINPKTEQKREVRTAEAIFRTGDKVIQLVNQPEDGVYNGDIGEVVAIFREEENTEQEEQLVIAFEDREVVYERKDYRNIMLAYCISIHKSQGSEFPIVILPVVRAYQRMLRKNLLYTAITRSKQSLIICGDQNSFLDGVATKHTNQRYTTLTQHLVEKLGEERERDGQNSTVFETEDANLSPYDFM